MIAMSLELEMDAINTVSLTRARVETVSETEAGETIDAVSIGATVDTVLAEEEMGATANVVLVGDEAVNAEDHTAICVKEEPAYRRCKTLIHIFFNILETLL